MRAWHMYVEDGKEVRISYLQSTPQKLSELHCTVQMGPAKKARRSRATGFTSKVPAKRKAAPRKKPAPLAPPVGARQRGGVHIQ